MKFSSYSSQSFDRLSMAENHHNSKSKTWIVILIVVPRGNLSLYESFALSETKIIITSYNISSMNI